MRHDIVDMMLEDGFLNQKSVMQLVKSYPPIRATLENLINADVLDVENVNKYIVKKVVQGTLSLDSIDEMNGVDIVSILKNVSMKLGIGYMDLKEETIDIRLYKDINHQTLVTHKAVLIKEVDGKIAVAFADPLHKDSIDAIQRLLPRKMIVASLSKSSEIEDFLARLSQSIDTKNIVCEVREELKNRRADADVKGASAIMRLIELILKSSINSRASDIHVEATENSCLIRTRIDGMLVESFLLEKDIFAPLASRIKLLANMDIAVKREPQDGRFSKNMKQGEFDFRVSTLPTIHGESIVIRVLNKSQMMMRLEDAGMSKLVYDRLVDVIFKPHGIVLVTGPTGSGKSTTLYGVISEIQNPNEKIITVENPVEYRLSGIQQVEINENFGLGFVDILRSILRQDPDKIMIGEIRDKQTLRMAIQSALTGHLVLSTMHTNDALGAIGRMREMEIESYLLSGALVAVQAQRLIRKICPNCKEKCSVEKVILGELVELLPKKYQFFKGTGCKRCHYSGYYGREMIAEILIVSEKISNLIAKDSSREKLYKQALKEGYVTMLKDGLNKALDGVTTIDEVLRVTKT